MAAREINGGSIARLVASLADRGRHRCGIQMSNRLFFGSTIVAGSCLGNERPVREDPRTRSALSGGRFAKRCFAIETMVPMITWTCYSAADATAVGNFGYARWSHAACAPPVAVDINNTTLFDSSMSSKSVTAQGNRIWPDGRASLLPAGIVQGLAAR